MADLDQLKGKYQSVLTLINQLQVRLQNLHLQDNKLFLKANAKTKAAAYAAGVDARLGPLLKLSEPDDSYGIPQAARAAAAFGDTDMHVDAGQQGVTASIHATFALDLG